MHKQRLAIKYLMHTCGLSFPCFVFNRTSEISKIFWNLILFSSFSSWNDHISYAYSRSLCSWLLQGQSCSQKRLPQSCYKGFCRRMAKLEIVWCFFFLSKASWTCWPRELSYPLKKVFQSMNTVSSTQKREEYNEFNQIYMT